MRFSALVGLLAALAPAAGWNAPRFGPRPTVADVAAAVSRDGASATVAARRRP